ncbi:unnamed protein product [Spirodela intermedia]|uniref:Uncharacterized protein n=1 Tax=Spirodela intermedia TaxID=51605 RepID=A0A7I8IWG0_SPIIN|nr:unnamed protein product [Spirodela intermedia]CAA6662013.1 unnamed protein product [Spirodela intermedia]
MRLYPPVPANTSHCLADDVLPDGTKVGKGWFVSYNAYAVGRMTAVWGEDYGKFRPERWLGTGGEFRPESPFRFPASHGGARTCPGKEMAYVQMKSIAACLIEKFTLEVAGGRPEMLLCLTLHMKDGLPVRVRERTPLADFPPPENPNLFPTSPQALVGSLKPTYPCPCIISMYVHLEVELSRMELRSHINGSIMWQFRFCLLIFC